MSAKADEEAVILKRAFTSARQTLKFIAVVRAFTLRRTKAKLEVQLDATGNIKESPLKGMPKGLLQALHHHCSNGIPISIGHRTKANFERAEPTFEEEKRNMKKNKGIHTQQSLYLQVPS